MKKSLIALAVAAAVVAPSANAATTLYGKVRQSLSQVDGVAFGGGYNFATSTTSSSDAIRIHDQSSRLGVKGSEDLGNGLAAIYQYEFGVGVNSNEKTATSATSGTAWTGDSLYNRNQFVGLKGGFGTFLVGRHDVPAKMVLGKVAYFFGGQHEADDAIGIGFASSIRANNVLAYVSPNMSGFTFIAATVAGEANSVSGTSAADGIADGVSVGLKYSNGPFYAGLGYTKLSEELLGATDDKKILGLALMYNPGPWQVGYLYENTDAALGGVGSYGTYSDSLLTNADGSALSINALAGYDEYESHLLVAGYKFGNNHLKAKYGIGSYAGSGSSDLDVDVMGLWLEHNMSKRTKIFAAYSKKSMDDFTVTDSAGLVTAVDGDNDIFSLGLEHSF